MTVAARWILALVLAPELLSNALAAPGAEPVAKPGGLSLSWVSADGGPRRAEVRLRGIGKATLREIAAAGWTTREWQRVLAVCVEEAGVLESVGLPPMLGTYRIEGDALRFQAQFPLEPGARYRATCWPSQLPGATHREAPLVARFEVPIPRRDPTTVVSHVYPSADVLPENLLKFYLHFSAPMSRGRIYEHIHLRDVDGKDVELPFLEIDEELWNPELTRLTLFIDPGRIKRGVLPLEEIGPALETGRRYVLAVDSDWSDSSGNPLREAFAKSFQVGPPDREPPDPSRWRVVSPNAGRRDALTVHFPEPMDHALALRVIGVVGDDGRAIEGVSALEDKESRWTFAPEDPWRRGSYWLAVQKAIEDLAGNNIGKPFEVDVFEGVQRRFTNAIVRLTFEIR